MREACKGKKIQSTDKKEEILTVIKGTTMNFQPVTILSTYVSLNFTGRKFLMWTNVHMNYLMKFFTGVSVKFSSAKIVLLAITHLKFNGVKLFILWYWKATYLLIFLRCTFLCFHFRELTRWTHAAVKFASLQRTYFCA